jgi:outer membrane protein assembly factor BamD (BamD/ComL family)
MRARTLLAATAIVSSLLGAVVAYLVLTVPNDVQAAALMKQARKDIEAGRSDAARTSLSKIVQQYPRTDAAASATVALVKLADDDRRQLQRELEIVKREQSRQIAVVNQMQTAVADVKATGDRLQATANRPAPPPAPKKAAPARKKHRRRR